jgi:uncharacterized protein YdaU (DUF1376 family)
MTKNKSTSHWYPRYSGDYARKTAHLSLVEHGAYTLLMDYYYTSGPIPISDTPNQGSFDVSFDVSSDDRLFRICRALDDRERRAVISVLKQFFVIENGCWINKRAEEELEKRRSISEIRKLAVETREEKRKQNTNKRQSSDVSNDISNDDTSTSTVLSIKEEDTNVSSKKKSVTLDELSLDHVRDWLDQKRANGMYLTVDEKRLLEMFKDFCIAKKPKYKDFVAAFRNSFGWNNTPKKGMKHEANSRKLTSEDILERKLAEIDAELEAGLASQGGAGSPDNFSDAPVLLIAGHLREDSGAT